LDAAVRGDAAASDLITSRTFESLIMDYLAVGRQSDKVLGKFHRSAVELKVYEKCQPEDVCYGWHRRPELAASLRATRDLSRQSIGSRNSANH
jgi:hypothetical protein